MRMMIAIVLLIAGCSKEASPPPGAAASRRPKVTAATAAEREVTYAVEAVGTLEALEEISIPAQVSGVVDAVKFKEGDAVDETTVLVEIDLERFRLAVRRAEADGARAAAQAGLAKTLYENRLKLYEEGRKQKKEWMTEEQLATWRADLQKAEADQARAAADLDLARSDLARATVRSPVPGFINGKLVSKGEFVRAETVVARIINLSSIRVRFTVPELEASRLRVGQEVSFTLRSAPGRELKAKLFFLSQKADPATRTVEAKAEVLDRPPDLRAGTFASVRIVTEARQSVLVPERAVLPTDRGFIVYVLNGTKAVSRPIRTGLRHESGVEVLEGLKAGEKVAVDGAATLWEGAEVEVTEEAP